MHSETEFTSRPSRLECLPATLKTHNLSNRKRSTILRLRVYEELSSISTSKNRLQIPSFCHNRYYAIWLSLKNLSLGRLWTTSPGNLQRRTHISSAALMDDLCGLQIQISVVFGNHALCQQMVWFTSLPAGNHRQLCSPNYLLYCPCYWISRTGLNVFRFLLGGLYIGQQTSTEGRYSSKFGSAAGSCLFSKN